MASKKQLVQSDLLVIPDLNAVDAGFIGLGARSDGLYLRKSNQNSERLLTETDYTTFVGSPITSSILLDSQITPGVYSVYISGGYNGWVVSTNSSDTVFSLLVTPMVGVVNFKQTALIHFSDNSFKIYSRFCVILNDVITWGDWQPAAGPTVDLSNYYTKDQTVSITELQTLLDGKENANTVIGQYYVNDLTGLTTAWSEAINSSLPTNIYLGGTITLTSNIELNPSTTGKQISLIGSPVATINLNGFDLITTGAFFQNINFSNPGTTTYLKVRGGYISLQNCSFRNDSLDASIASANSAPAPIPHITIIDGSGTGSITLNGVSHFTNDYFWNSGSLLLQPVWIRITPNYTNMYVIITNMSAGMGFERYSRVLIEAQTANTTVRVSGDTSWFYVPEQVYSGSGNFSSSSTIRKEIAIDKVLIGKVDSEEGRNKFLSVGSDNKIKETTSPVVRVDTLASLLLATTWTSFGISPFIEMLVIIYNDGTNNGLYELKAADYTQSGNWQKTGAVVDLSNYLQKNGDGSSLTGLTKAQVGLGNVDNTSDVNKPVSTAQQTALNGKENIGVAAQLISDLKDGVTSAGDTLQKLYNLVVGAIEQQVVANIAARDAFNIPHLPFSLFVQDDGDGKWAIYQAITTGIGATFVKTSDPDLLNAVMSNAAVKVAYESNPDTNALTNALLSKLNGIAAGAQVNVLESISVNGVALDINSKNTDLTILKTWVTGTTYKAGNSVVDSTKIYRILQNHTSSTITADIASGYIEQVGGGDLSSYCLYVERNKLIRASGTTTDSIIPDFTTDIWQTDNNGTLSILIDTFTNLPTFGCTRLLKIKNVRASSMAVTFRTTDLTQNGITYTFVQFSASTMNIPASKRAEVSYLFDFVDPTHCMVHTIYTVQP